MKVRFWVESYCLRYWCSGEGYTQKMLVKNSIADTIDELVDIVMEDFKEYYSTHNSRTYNPCYGGMAHRGWFSPFASRIMKGKENYPTARYNESEKKFEVINEEEDVWRSELTKYFDKVCKQNTPIDLKGSEETKYDLGHSFMCTYNYDENGKAYCEKTELEDYIGLIDIDRLGYHDDALWSKPWGGQDIFHVEFGIVCEEEDN